jgi:SAM-dependent methyltransferase
MLCDTERSLLIDAVMRSHPAVRDSVTVTWGDSRFATFLVPETELKPPPGNDIDPAGIWRRVWNLTYAYAGSSARDDLNLAGWISSYTGQPMSESDMREWVRDSAASVMATGVRTYLEIGCGTGLLLLRIAPASDRCLGTDFSETAIRYTARAIRARQLADRAALAVCSAENIAALVGSQRFECVIINSVALDNVQPRGHLLASYREANEQRD